MRPPVAEDLRSLTVVLTSSCNLRCSYCYQRPTTASRVAWSSLRPALDLLLASRHPRPRVAFSGGEPLLQPGLLRRAIEYLGHRRPADPCVPEIVVSTNGTLLDGEMIQVLARHRVKTWISFDGLRPAQELRAPGTFHHLDRLLEELRHHHADFFRNQVSVSLTLTAANLGHLADSIRYFLDHGVHEIAVSPMSTFDPGWRPVLIDELDRQMTRVADLARAVFEWTGHQPIEVLRRSRATPPDRRRRPMPMCSALSGRGLALDTDGSLVGCVLLAHSLRPFPDSPMGDALKGLGPGRPGEVAGGSAPAAHRGTGLSARLFSHKEAKISSYGRCASCEVLAECIVCPVATAHIPGNADPDRVDDLQCAFHLVVGRHRRLMPPQPTAADVLRGTAPLPRAMEELRTVVLGRPGRD